MRLIFFLCIMVVGGFHPALAQEAVNAAPPPEEALMAEAEPETTPGTRPDEEDNLIPDEVFREAKIFEKYCSIQPNFRPYYDCECLAASFLDERIEQGPDASRSSIMLAIEDRCQDATEAAGIQYNTCLGNALLLPRNIEPEAYCSCYANQFAEIFEDNKVKPGPGNLTRVQTMAHTECRKEGVADKYLR